MPTRTIIRTDDDAFAWISAQVEAGRLAQPELVDEAGVQLVVYTHACTRCSGSGCYTSVTTGRVGPCWGCVGRRTVSKRLAPVEFARRLRRNLRAQERRAAAKRQRVEASKAANAARGYGRVSGRELYRARKDARMARSRSLAALREHVGEVGETLELSVVLTRVREVETRWGARQVHELLDERGNLLVFWAGEVLGVEGERPRLRVRATVKRHGRWQGIARTELAALEVLAAEGEEPLPSAADLLVLADRLELVGEALLADVERQALAAGDVEDWRLRELAEHPAVRRGLLMLQSRLVPRAA